MSRRPLDGGKASLKDNPIDESTGSKILRGTIVIAAMSLLAKLASFIVEATLAAFLGTSGQGDAYYMVSGVKDLFYPMLSVGIWKVFLPLYKERVSLGDQDGANSLANKTITVFTLASAVTVACVILLAEQIVGIVAPGFEGTTREICIRLVKTSCACYIPIIASAVYATMLQCHSKFFGSQVREVVSHLPIIAAAILYPRFGIDALAVGLVASGVVRLLVELPFVDWGYRFRPDLRLQDRGFAEMTRRLPSSLVSEGVVQLNTLVDKSMASTLPGGTVSALSYGQRLTNVFSGMLSSALTTALYPQMVELIALKNGEKLGKLLSRIIRLFCVVMVPITFACLLYGNELVSVAFQRGSFDQDSVRLTSGVFSCYSLGMFFTACNVLINNVFYGYGDTATPMRASIVTLVFNAVGNVILMRLWGANGFALSTTISCVASFVMRARLVTKRVEVGWGSVVKLSAKVGLASVVACMPSRMVLWMIPTNRVVALAAAVLTAVPVYLLLLKWFDIKELDDVINLIKSKTLKV